MFPGVGQRIGTDQSTKTMQNLLPIKPSIKSWRISKVTLTGVRVKVVQDIEYPFLNIDWNKSVEKNPLPWKTGKVSFLSGHVRKSTNAKGNDLKPIYRFVFAEYLKVMANSGWPAWTARWSGVILNSIKVESLLKSREQAREDHCPYERPTIQRLVEDLLFVLRVSISRGCIVCTETRRFSPNRVTTSSGISVLFIQKEISNYGNL